MSSPHRIARARWPLTIFAVGLVLITIMSGWHGVRYSWAGGSVSVSAGGIGLNHAENPGIFGSPIRGWGLEIDWTNPAWFHSIELSHLPGYHNHFVSFVPFAVLACVAALFGWYRHARPFVRPNRPNRRHQFRFIRWLCTTLCAISLFAAIASYWIVFEYQTAKTQIFAVNAIVSAVHNEQPKAPVPPPGVSPSNWAAVMRPDIAPRFSLVGSRSTVPWRGRIYQFYWANWPDWSHILNLWFLWAVLLMPTAFFWFLHLRRYPSSTHCARCHYNRAGIRPHSPCPECGHVPPVRPS